MFYAFLTWARVRAVRQRRGRGGQGVGRQQTGLKKDIWYFDKASSTPRTDVSLVSLYASTFTCKLRCTRGYFHVRASSALNLLSVPSSNPFTRLLFPSRPVKVFSQRTASQDGKYFLRPLLAGVFRVSSSSHGRPFVIPSRPSSSSSPQHFIASQASLPPT